MMMSFQWKLESNPCHSAGVGANWFGVLIQLLPESMRGRFFDARDAKCTKRTEWSDSGSIERPVYTTVFLSASEARDNV